MRRTIFGSMTLVLSISLFNAAAFNSAMAFQEFFIDFDSILMAVDGGAVPGTMGIPPADELYEYDAMQREDIIFYLNQRYAQHDVVFTAGLPPVPGASVISLNSGSGGSSDGVDFRNLDGGDDAKVNTIAAFKFVGKDAVTDPWTNNDVTIATANLVGHEAGHLMGLRHQDSFGPISTGIGSFPSDYAPTYPFPSGAPETPEALMFLTAGLGLSFGGLVTPSYLSERSAIKLEMAKPSFDDLVVAEASGNHEVGMAQPIDLADFMTPYPFRDIPDLTMVPVEDLPIDFRTDITARGRVVTGSLDDTDGGGKLLSDYFNFEAEAGTFITIEVMSAILEGGDRYVDPVDMGIILLDGVSGAPLPYGPSTPGVTAANDDDFATSERGATLLDVELPVVDDTDFGTGIGTYVIEILSADEVLFFVEPGPGKMGFDGGDYELLIYQAMIDEAPFPPGFADFDRDGDVDGADFRLWQRGLGIASGAEKSDGDADNDGGVDNFDLFLWELQFGIVGLPVPIGTSTTVPEPTSGVLLSMLVVGFAGLRRRI